MIVRWFQAWHKREIFGNVKSASFLIDALEWLIQQVSKLTRF